MTWHLHKWGPWRDIDVIYRSTPSNKVTLVVSGQRRGCTVCSKTKVRESER